MLPFVVLDRIESEKIKYMCRVYIEGLHHKVGKHFYLYLKDFYLDEQELEVTIGLIPKPNLVFISKYLDPRVATKTYPALDGKNFIRVDPGNNKDQFSVHKYNLHRLIAPMNYKNYIDTELEKTKILLRNVMSSDTLVSSPIGIVEGIRIDPLHLGRFLI